MTTTYPAHEGLQVAPDTGNDPEVYYSDGGPEVISQLKPVEYVRTQPKRICGMRRDRAFLALGLAAVLIIGAVVGGVVGGIESRSSRGNNSSTATTAPVRSASGTSSVSATSSSAAIPTSGVLPLNCPAINNTQFSTAGSGSAISTFLLFCKMNLAGDPITSSRQVSLDACVGSCVDYNGAGPLPTCQGLTFGANMTLYNTSNCFLKSNITRKIPYVGTPGENPQAAAVLLN